MRFRCTETPYINEAAIEGNIVAIRAINTPITPVTNIFFALLCLSVSPCDVAYKKPANTNMTPATMMTMSLSRLAIYLMDEYAHTVPAPEIGLPLSIVLIELLAVSSPVAPSYPKSAYG